MKDPRLGKPVIDQLRHAIPCEPVFLAAPPERASPEVGHMVPEGRRARPFGWDRVVREVAGHDLPASPDAQPSGKHGLSCITEAAISSSRRQTKTTASAKNNHQLDC